MAAGSSINKEQKKNIIENAIKKYGDTDIQNITENLNTEQIDFLFQYLSTEDKKNREILRAEMQKKYTTLLNKLSMEAEQIQKIMTKFHELSSREASSSIDDILNNL